MASGVWAACSANSSGKVADGIARAVSFQPRRMMARSSGASISRLADRTLGIGNRCLQQANEPAHERLDAGAVEQVGGIFHHPADPRRRPSAPRSSPRLTDRSNFALEVATRSKPQLSPSSSSFTSAVFCSTSITWNSGCRDSDRAGLSTSTSRSNGTSWWL